MSLPRIHVHHPVASRCSSDGTPASNVLVLQRGDNTLHQLHIFHMVGLFDGNADVSIIIHDSLSLIDHVAEDLVSS